MKKIKIIYKNNIKKNKLNYKLSKNFNKNLDNIVSCLDTTKNNFHSLSKNFKLNFKTSDIQRFKKYKIIALIGMGGSILGVEAIYFFLKHKIKKNFIFFNNIDKEKLQIFKSENDLSKVLFIVISKSGNTIETFSNLLSFNILKKNSKNIIIISENTDNALYLLAKKLNLFHIEHKKYIGGRYSVLSEVGLLPAYFMNLKVNNLRANLSTLLRQKNKRFLKDSVTILANLFNRNKYKNIIFFNYEPKLNKFLYWNQQLIAESLGKKGKGFLPLISEAPKDHHSLLQLYLDGPKDKLFYIFSSEIKDKTKITKNNLSTQVQFLKDHSLNQIKTAQKNAFVKTLVKKKIPFREFKILDFTEEALGELFSYFMLETALIGKLSNVDPFDQPAVEQVKINTKKLLT